MGDERALRILRSVTSVFAAVGWVVSVWTRRVQPAPAEGSTECSTADAPETPAAVMSSAQRIERARAQIRKWVAEIADLSKQDIAPPEFFAAFLTRLVASLAAHDAAIWLIGGSGRLTLTCSTHPLQKSLSERQNAIAHARLLDEVLASDRGLLVPPSAPDRRGPSANPTDSLLVLAPIRMPSGNGVGVVEVFQRTESADHTRKGYQRFVEQMCALAGDYLTQREWPRIR